MIGSRADLLRVLAQLGPAVATATAPSLGFACAQPEEEAPAKTTGETPPVEAAPPNSPSAEPPIPNAAGWPQTRAPTIFWRVEADEQLAHAPVHPPPPTRLTPADRHDPARSLLFLPPMRPICPWPRLEARLRAALNAGRPGTELDVETAVDRVAAREPLEPVPCLPAARWPATLCLWEDRRSRLSHLGLDQDALRARLEGALGPAAVDTQWLTGGDPVDMLLLAPRVAGPVLVLGDLGFFGGAHLQSRWAALGRALAARGQTPVALLPLCPSRLPAALRGAWRCLPWEARARDTITPAVRARGTHRLLRLCAIASLVQPGLMRELRLLLPRDEVDLSTELEIAGARPVRAADGSGILLDAEQAAALLLELKKEEPAILSQALVVRERWRGKTPIALDRGERVALIQAGYLPEADPTCRDFLRGLSAALAGGAEEATWGAFARRLLLRVSDAAWAAGPYTEDLRTLFVSAHTHHKPRRYPPGLRPEDLVGSRPPRLLALRQVGAQLVWEEPAGDPADPKTPRRPGSPVTELMVGDTVLVGPERGPVAVRVGARLDLSPASPLILEAGGRRLTIAPWVVERDWAIAAGRDRFGLWADVDLGGVPYRMRWIPPGRFWMGSPESEEGRFGDEGPRHEVVLTQGYWLGQTPVTQAHWLAVKKVNPAEFKGTPGSLEMQRPVERVSWDECRDFADPFGLRLPTEAEWERACRAGTDGPNHAPDVPLSEIGWYDKNSGGQTQPVGRLRPNRWGLYDTLGNVWEWCHDSWRDRYEAGTQYDPRYDVRGGLRVNRGGGWVSSAPWLRAACRYRGHPGGRRRNLGVRLARGPALQPSAEPTTSE